jgi:MFS family permease
VRKSSRAPWFVVAAVCVGAFMAQLDASIVTVALPHIGRALDVGAGTTQWVTLAYMLVLFPALGVAGMLADVFGRKLLYTWGFAVFTFASLLCGIAPSLPLLIAARVLQGLGAAMLQANSVALIREALPDGKLARGLGVQGAAQAVGLAMGPAVGGLLVAFGGWRLIFFVNVPVGFIAIALARTLIPRSRHARARTDGLAPAFADETIANDELDIGDTQDLDGARGKDDDRGARAARRLLTSPTVAVGVTAGLISYMTMFGALFVVPYYLLATGLGPSTSGLELACLPVTLGLVAPLAGRATARIGTRPLAVTGMVLLACGLTLLALEPTGASRLLALALAGGGLGMFTPVNNASVMAAGSRRRAGLLGGVLNMARTLGAILGVALASALYTSFAGGGTAARASDASTGLLVTLLVFAAFAMFAACLLLAQPANHRLKRA